MQKKLTISIDEEVYRGLLRVVGRGKISRFLESLARPLVAGPDLESEYREMSLDQEAEQEALEWANAFVGDIVQLGLDLF